MTDNTRLLAKLYAVAVRFKAEMRATIDRVNAPEIIKDVIGVGNPQSTNNVFYIDVTIPLKDAPQAAAFEWGSGEREEGGGGEEYPIPKQGTWDMYWDRADWPQYQPPPRAPRVFHFLKVMHPGVYPRPYIRPSIKAILPDAKRILSEAVKADLSILSKDTEGNVEIIEVGRYT